MKAGLLIFSLWLCSSQPLAGQDIPGLSYCLLFDSNLERQAFQKSPGKECDPLLFLLAYDPKIDSARYVQVGDELRTYAKKLQIRRGRFRSEARFLHYVFYKVHNKYLKNFDQLGNFIGIFDKRSYNCVSGTALYAYLLTQLGYSPKLYETRYHVFLLMDLKDSTRILFDATDPLRGFSHHGGKINKRIRQYLAGEQEAIAKRLVLSAPFNDRLILQEVSLKELAGLHYYNLAVQFNNKKNYYDAFRALKKATVLYPESERIKDFLRFTHIKYESELSAAFVNN